MHVSVADLKKNYANLNVEFDLWKGESDAEPYIEDMIQCIAALESAMATLGWNQTVGKGLQAFLAYSDK